MPYTLFKAEVGKHNVQAIYSRGETLTGRFVTPVTLPAGERQARRRSGRSRERPRGAAPRTAANGESLRDDAAAFVDPGLEKHS